MRRVVQRMLEETSYVGAFGAEGQPASPRGATVFLGKRRQSVGLLFELIHNGSRLLRGVALGRGLDEVGLDRRVMRFVFGEGLFDSERVERGHVAAVRGVLDRRPHLGRRPHAQVGSGRLDQYAPARSEGAELTGQRAIVEPAAVEVALVTALGIYGCCNPPRPAAVPSC